jgi:hypothetical protein
MNLAVEMAVMILSLALLWDQMHHEDFDASVNEEIRRSKIEKAFKKWRVKFFGPPPPTEEQIAHMTKLVHIEAAKIVREAS